MWTTALLFLRLVVDPAQPRHAQALIKQVADSGRCVTLAESPDERVAPPKMVPVGQPPLLTFRYYESKAHNHAGNAGLMLDDAGH